ncbi:NAD-dependent epimerase/dehydratase family protein [Sphingobacterium multivorum]|uniref:NAD-dependent epimerase/dehydratase family protein n=1 Tax=Sphingobacterium multivorum TaxID=28454 RepID=UPI0028A260CB|nr:NAD-dependent epimerase/dehydratase family protein [Sphingobacterium multivorum]
MMTDLKYSGEKNLKGYFFGSSGFIGKHLFTYLKDHSIDLEARSARGDSWHRLNDKVALVYINLVGKAHDHQGLATEMDYYYVNVELTKKIFLEFVHSKAELFIHVSSLAAVEEFESIQPLNETDECRPQSFYGKSKRAAELWLLKQQLPANKKLIILRPPMVHGKGDKGNLGLLYKLISKGIPYPLSAFDNKRSFICIDNFMFFVYQITEHYKRLESGIYHIADDQSIATSEIVSIIKNVLGKNVLNISLPKVLILAIAKIGDFIPIPLNSKRLKKMTANLTVDSSKIKQQLGVVELPYTAKDGLHKTISDFYIQKSHS